MIERYLKTLARIQLDHTNAIIAGSVVLTLVLGLGIPQIQIQTDFEGSLPDTLDPVEAEDRIEKKFGNTESITIFFQVNDEPKQPSSVSDIRDPRVIHTLNWLENDLERESIVKSTNSMGVLFRENPEDKQEVVETLDSTDANFVNRDFTATMMFVELEEEMTEENVKEATALIEENIEESPTYPGLDISVTGNPVMRTTLSDFMVTDSASTIALASGLILLLLIGVRGIFYGPATFLPLFLGLLWTLGAMGILGLPLTIGTIAMGSMLLGLGVEYGSFIAERIIEEADHHDVETAITKTMPTTGKAVLGSSTTDLVGFLALLAASISFVRDLGLTLALGEGLTVMAAIVLIPALIIKRQRWKNE